jgi:hypothetical protein
MSLASSTATAVLALLAPVAQAAIHIESAISEMPRVVVLTDIGTDPDDEESLVRLLLYTNELEVEGLIATTSTWQREAVHPELIEERIHAYGAVLSNLREHAPGYPDEKALLDRIKSGPALYGLAGVGDRKDSPASELLIAAVERPDPRCRVVRFRPRSDPVSLVAVPGSQQRSFRASPAAGVKAGE